MVRGGGDLSHAGLAGAPSAARLSRMDRWATAAQGPSDTGSTHGPVGRGRSGTVAAPVLARLSVGL